MATSGRRSITGSRDERSLRIVVIQTKLLGDDVV
jgi:hypothetical protein